tara:strand:+ start:65 stop:259 length:195 start_codon:yes stop_codon:yes gene_type:complete
VRRTFYSFSSLNSSSTSRFVLVLVEKEEEGGRRRHRASYIIEFVLFFEIFKRSVFAFIKKNLKI